MKFSFVYIVLNHNNGKDPTIIQGKPNTESFKANLKSRECLSPESKLGTGSKEEAPQS